MAVRRLLAFLGVSIHALLAECDSYSYHSIYYIQNVSIHALLAECDKNNDKLSSSKGGFNPRTPCGVRLPLKRGAGCRKKFQSTHSLRSATEAIRHLGLKDEVSIHALLAECDVWKSLSLGMGSSFNPRTPCGVRPDLPFSSSSATRFNPRTPCGVRLKFATITKINNMVSIHALLAECDMLRAQ